MIEVSVPEFGDLQLMHAICDFNGTLAVEGVLIDGIEGRLNKLSERLHLHIITGDSFGKAKSELSQINCKLTILPAEDQATLKKKYIQELGPKNTVAIGNGRNDRFMLKDAILGIAVLGQEGAAIEAILSANVVMPDISSTLDTLLHPKRLIATLRS